jgi:methylmalonyl-CoA/ethylmalonyl-CoA epimerase
MAAEVTGVSHVPHHFVRLHHVGFVVAEIESAAQSFQKSMDAGWDGRIFLDPLQKVRVTFLAPRPGESQIELVEPLGDDSPVRKFLAEKGGGLHHLCYEVADLEAELVALRARGSYIMKRPKPAVAFDGRLIAWIRTPAALLIELLETAPANRG